MIDLTEEQLRTLMEHYEFLPKVRNPHTNEVFVLMHVEMYERILPLIEEDEELPALEDWLRLSSEVLEADDEEHSSSAESA